MKNFGFSLIELLVVVAIIAVLAAIAVSNYIQYQRRAQTESSLNLIQLALTNMVLDYTKGISNSNGHPAQYQPGISGPSDPGITLINYPGSVPTSPMSLNIFLKPCAYGDCTSFPSTLTASGNTNWIQIAFTGTDVNGAIKWTCAFTGGGTGATLYHNTLTAYFSNLGCTG